jgi:NitT/TauT family transport system permease protein
MSAPDTPGLWAELVSFRGTSSRGVDLWLAVVAFAGVGLIWQASSTFGWTSPQFLPSPGAVLAALVDMLRDQNFLWHIAVSVFRVWAAFLLSLVMALPLGILMSTYRLAGALNEPLIDFIRYLPVPALVPLTIIWLGIGEETKIALLWMGTFFQLVLLIADDMKRVPHEYVEIGFTLGAKPFQILKDVALPSMMPSLVDNLRITLGWCWTYLIIAEIVASDSGIGFVIWTARRYVKTPEVMAGILTIGIVGLLCDQAIRVAHRRWFRYL